MQNAEENKLKLKLKLKHYVRPSFAVSRGIFSWSSHYSKIPSGDWMVFQAGGATTIDSFAKHVD